MIKCARECLLGLLPIAALKTETPTGKPKFVKFVMLVITLRPSILAFRETKFNSCPQVILAQSLSTNTAVESMPPINVSDVLLDIT